MEKALVTGGAGFIGSYLVDKLVQMKIPVMVIDNMSSGQEVNFAHHLGNPNQYNIAFKDIQDPGIESIFSNFQPDTIFHLAARPGVAYSVKNPTISDLSNINGTVHLLELARKYNVRRFIFSSSSSVYGGSEVLPTLETTPLNPKSPYALQKKVGEEYCQLFSKQYGLETVALRYFNIFGKRQLGTSPYAAVIAAFLHAKQNNLRPTIHGDGEQFRDFTPVENVVFANIQAALNSQKCNGQVFNIGCGKRTTVNQIYQMIGGLPPVYTEARPGDVKCSQASIEKAKEYFGYHLVKDFEEAVQSLL